MIYIQQGLTASRMKEVKSPYSDFETLISVKTIEVKAEDISTEIELPNGQTTTKAKGTLSYYFLAGELKGNKRSNETVVSRSLVVIDYDGLIITLEEAKELVSVNFSEYSYFLYPTISHTEGDTRFRIVVDCDRSMHKAEFEATLKEIGEVIGLPFDEASLTYSQMMALPITTTDNLETFEQSKVINQGKPYAVVAAEREEQATKTFQVIYSETYRGQNGKGKIVQLLEEVLQGVENGSRNNFIARAYGTLLTANMDVSAATTLIREWNDRFVNPPLSDRELLGVLKSISKRENKKRKG